jgi:alpha-beta hydrolase superfamily lysophospholipase
MRPAWGTKQRRLRRAGADLNVYEGMRHAQFGGPDSPEAREIFQNIGRFFDRRLAR